MKTKGIFMDWSQFRSTLLNLLLMTMIILNTGCEKELDPGLPDDQLIGITVFEDEATVNAAIASIYTGLRDNSPLTGNTAGLNVLLGLYAAFYNHTIISANGGVADFWRKSYALIYQCNAVLEGLEKSELEENVKKPFIGEALFLRAYIHFYLSNLFGSIPYIKSTDYTINASVSRMPLEAVNNDIEKDLSTAKSLLPNMDNSGERLRVSKEVASATLARLYLYTEQWEKAYAESNSIITSGVYVWQSDLNQVFLKECPSTIWQLKPEFEGGPTKEAETFVFEEGPPPLYALTPNFIEGFETGDLRREFWTREISNGGQSWFQPYKYKQNTPSGSSSEYSVLFREGELYLIRAEASIHMGDLGTAKNDIDKIRLRAGLQATTASTPEDLMDELLKQRKYELFTEQGHRWFDLKRSQQANEILAPIKTGWKNTDILFPLPERELLLNPKLKPQNPGY